MTTRSKQTLKEIKQDIKESVGDSKLLKDREETQKGSRSSTQNENPNAYTQQDRTDRRTKASKQKKEPRVYSSVNEGLEDLNIKRPRNGYILFTLDYRDKVEREGFNGPDGIAELARRWRNLDKETKDRYNKMGEMESERYFRQKDSAGIITPSKSRRRRGGGSRASQADEDEDEDDEGPEVDRSGKPIDKSYNRRKVGRKVSQKNRMHRRRTSSGRQGSDEGDYEYDEDQDEDFNVDEEDYEDNDDNQ